MPRLFLCGERSVPYQRERHTPADHRSSQGARASAIQRRGSGGVVSREMDRWFISVTVEAGEPDSDVPAGVPVGVDLGIRVFAKLSTGEEVFAPMPLQKAQAILRRLN